jgi:hypothetical protein
MAWMAAIKALHGVIDNHVEEGARFLLLQEGCLLGGIEFEEGFARELAEGCFEFRDAGLVGRWEPPEGPG